MTLTAYIMYTARGNGEIVIRRQMSRSVHMRAVEQHWRKHLTTSGNKEDESGEPEDHTAYIYQPLEGDVGLPTGMYTVLPISVHFSHTPLRAQ